MSRPQRIISIPDYRNKVVDGEQVTFYDIYLNGKLCCTKRYSDFASLNTQLRVEFPGYNFARFPMKWFFALTEPQVEERRKQLDEFMKVALANNAVAESKLMQDFLTLDDEAAAGDASTVEVLVKLPDKTNISVVASLSYTTVDLYKTVVKKLGLKDSSANFFALFEIVDGFERKLKPQEIPLEIINRRVSAKKGSSTSLIEVLSLRKWIFTRSQEVFVSDDEVAVSLLYGQAREDVFKGNLKPSDEQMRALNEYKLNGLKIQYLDIARKIPHYATLFFPPCRCQVGKDTYDNAQMGFSVDGVFVKTSSASPKCDFTFKLPLIKRWKFDESEALFKFEYDTAEFSGWVIIYTPLYDYANEALLRVITELAWSREANARKKSEGANQSSVDGIASYLSITTITDYAVWGAQKAASLVHGTINFFAATNDQQTGGRGSGSDAGEHTIDMDHLGDNRL